jgi:nucleoside diphosphate kinase
MFVREPGPLYGLSIAATLPVLALVNLKLLEEKLDSQNEKIYGVVIVCMFVFASLVTFSNLSTAIEKYRYIVKIENSAYVETNKFISNYAKSTNPVIIHTPDSLDECAVLLFGRGYAHLQIDSQLSQICPNQYYYDFWVKELFVKEERYALNQVDWDLLIVGKSYLYQELLSLIRKETVHEITPGYIIVENKR